MEDNKLLKFLEHFSIITVAENKIPNFAWKIHQTEKKTPARLLNEWNYKGGKFRQDGTEIPATTNFGIVTGFEDLEVIDVDLKVFSTAQERKDFWNEFLQNLQDNILDFEEKFAVYKTKNEGFHILYKSKRVEGNLKLASLKGHKEAVIETRGTGGYVFAYPENHYLGKNYFEIDYVSDQDREVIMIFAKTYNYIEETKDFENIIDKKTKNNFTVDGIKTWDDYNEKTNIWDLISGEFTIPPRGNKEKHVLVKRHNSNSPHSGYIYKDSNSLYLFSTGTRYPNEKLLKPFSIYAIQNHGGDTTKAAWDLYEKGYGSRMQKEIIELPKKPVIENHDFPIEIFPDPIQSYILECADKLDSNVDYMGCSLIWLISVCIGNSIEMEVKNGWIENPTVWISLVGKAGIGKTPSIKNIIFPLESVNNREVRNYFKELEKFEAYDNLTKKEKEESVEVKKPIKKQFIANDITLEALVDLHQESDNAVGVFKDELAGWLKDMNKYRAGSDLEFWLSCWSGKSVFLNRLTRKGSFVDKPFIPVLGGIQPNILNSFYTEENKDNGFMDRMLLSFPESKIENYNENELSYDILSWYKETIIRFFEKCKRSILRNEDGTINSYKANFDANAKNEWKRIFNKISAFQNDENENEYLKSMYPKQKSYVPRFALLIHVFNEFLNPNSNSLLISKESILKAEKLSEYFIATAKKVKVNSTEVAEIKQSSKAGKNTFDKLKLIYESNPDFNRSQTAEILGVSRQYIIRMIKKIENNKV